MPARSKAQQKAAGAALSAKRGEAKPSKLIGASRQMYESMSEEQLDDMASTPRKNKPDYSPRSPVPAKKRVAKAANKARRRPSTSKGKTANAKRKSKKANRPRRAPKKAARRRA